MAAPSPAQIRYQMQHASDDRSTEIISAFGVCLGIAIITVFSRFIARHMTRAPLGGDDWTIVSGLMCAIGYVIGQAVCVSYGFGKHQVFVKDPVAIAKALSASIIFYIASLSFTKISILLLYRRIFPNREFHAILWGVGIFVTAFTIANIFFVIFKCNPVKGGFNPFIRAKCINGDAAILSVAIMTIMTDFIILCLPLPLVWKLQLPKIRKFQLTLIFLLGTFASVVSIYRATQILNVSDADLSYDSTNRSIWSGVEICAAIVCANLPALRPIVKSLFGGQPFLTAKSVNTSRGTTIGTGKSSQRRWTWRQVAPVTSETGKDGRFHRLEQHSGIRCTDDVERQKYEGYMMSPVISPMGSPKMPESAHF